MNKRRNRKALRLMAYIAAAMMLIFNVSVASYNPTAEAAADKTLTMDKLQYLKGEAITLSYTGAAGSDWVGIFATGTVPPGNTLTWKYLNSGDGTTSFSIGLDPGTYDAIYMINDGYEVVDRKTFEVVEHVAVSGVTLNQQDVQMIQGETTTLTAAVAPANATDKQVSWTSSDPAVVSVASTDGVATLTGNSPGTATVTVTTSDGDFTSSATVTVNPEPTLQFIIESAQAKYDAAVEGDGDGLYAAGSKAQLQSAIDAASAVANDSNATEEQVDSAKAALEEAIQVFDAKRISANVNGDDRISIGDVAVVSGAYGKQQDQEGWNEQADVNHDGKVDIVDLEIVSQAILQ